MKKFILLSVFFSLFLPSLAQAEVVDDPFTVYIQEKLIALGLLEGEPTGINNQATQQAIKTFQEKAKITLEAEIFVKFNLVRINYFNVTWHYVAFTSIDIDLTISG